MIEIVPEGGAQRGLVTFFHHHQIDRRGPQLLRLDVEQLGERPGLGFEALDPPFRLLERGFGGIEPLPRRRLRGFRAQRRRFRLGDRALRALDRRGQRREPAAHAGLVLERRELGLDLADLGLDPAQPFAMLA